MLEFDIQHCKSKVKLWLDRNTKERTFDSANRVLSLLIILQNCLQIRFYRPYKVDKKINELTYNISAKRSN